MAERSTAHAALGRAVRQARIDRGISQEALGHLCGMDRTYVGGIERGEKNPSYELLLRLCRGLEVAPSELVARAEALERAA